MMTLRRWVADNLGLPPWLILAPVGTLAAAWLPHRGPKMYFDFLFRPLIRQMFPCMDPFVTIDISGERDYSMDGAKFCDAYEEVRAYIPEPGVRAGGDGAQRGGRRRGSNKVWSYIDFDHPTTFESLAMHPEKKRKIMDDLDDFRSSKDYYRRIGKVWKRGYLLYGPPGTGKSSMIAAMANYLNYDIYDIELTTVPSNNDLRKLFIETKGKSIIVIEDIDCSLDLTGQRNSAATTMAVAGAKRKRRTSRMTLSGLLNFTDGIWSAHGGERIIVFTTNFVDKLDPALIRCGRMDMHIEMSYCSFEAYMTLAKNYLDLDTHPLFGTVEKLLQMVEITPANVAECLMMSNCTERRADLCLGRLIDELKKRVQEKEMDMKRAKEEHAASAAAGGDAKPNGGEDTGKS
ncbi:unnamed protein product [Urochloa decumbens]|uniref:AAA+ ATPase domain-containing protein n=1 Tax=Urochloa decumbens TaxID=240449 RepID=A0ABC9G7B1_9POAL